MKKIHPLVGSIAIAFWLLASCQAPKEEGEENQVAEKAIKNIIFMVGDGMGVTQVSAGYFANNFSLELARCSHVGLMHTFSADALITDSAAGATAFASGVKTYNGAIGVDTDTVAVPTLLEMAAEQGKATGLIATSTITHATPAVYYAHVKHRKMEEAIALELLNSPINFFAGGGRKFFDQRKEDDRNLLDEFMQKGFQIFTKVEEPNVIESDHVGILIHDESPEPYAMGRGDFLPEASALSLEFLNKNEKGFFLMIEGSQIDWGGHANTTEYIIGEMLDFDKAIGKVLDFAEQDGETLVVITADHETGGFAINKGNRDGTEIEGGFTTGSHTATMVPIFAYGPGAERFTGMLDNTEVFERLKELAGY